MFVSDQWFIVTVGEKLFNTNDADGSKNIDIITFE